MFSCCCNQHEDDSDDLEFQHVSYANALSSSYSASDTQLFKRYGQKFFIADIFLVEVPLANTFTLAKKSPLPKGPPKPVQVFPASTNEHNFKEFDLEVVDARLTADRSVLRVPIHSAPLIIQKILRRNAPVSESLRERHLFSGPGRLTPEDALQMALKRNNRIGKLTVFQDPGEFILCSSQEKYGSIVVTMSVDKVPTYHCVYENGVWKAFFTGEFHVVLSEEGEHFIGYLISNVIFP